MVRVAALLAQEGPGKGEPEDDGLRWLRCAACGSGAVASGGEVHPAPRPFGSVEGLPEVDARIWDEARTCFGAAAYTAAVMLCRKLLFHIAVDKGVRGHEKVPTGGQVAVPSGGQEKSPLFVVS